MFRIRPVRKEDASHLEQLAMEAHVGLTNFPKNQTRRNALLERVYATFQGKAALPYYLFALEDSLQKSVVGVSGIFPSTGGADPLEYFRLERHSNPQIFEEMVDHYETLNKVSYAEGPTEICSLYLAQFLRKEGLGKLLSFSRFLFMKAFPELFHAQVFAEMRGFSDEAGNSPFWDAVGRKFCPISYSELLARRDRGEKNASSLFPPVPLLIDLLPRELRPIIGSTHPCTTPAINILFTQGFKKTGELDLYDAGPRILADREEIKTIKYAKRAIIADIKAVQSPSFLLSNTRMDFRACYGRALPKESEIVLDGDAAKLLEVDKGDEILFLN
jgi:arginine N-succinyltransferase